jgi:hypothetical protein
MSFFQQCNLDERNHKPREGPYTLMQMIAIRSRWYTFEYVMERVDNNVLFGGGLKSKP